MTMAVKKPPKMREEPERRPFNTNMDKELIKEAQIRCLTNDHNMNDVMERLLRLWLDGKIKIELD